MRPFARLFLGLAFALLVCQPASHAQESALPSPAVALFKDYPRPDVGLPFADYTQAWPARWRRESSTIQGEIIPFAGPNRRPQSSRTFRPIPSDAPELTAPIEALRKAAGTEAGPSFRGERDNAFVYEVMTAPQGREVPRSRRHDAALDFMFVSGTPADGDINDVVEIERTWFSLFEPIAPEDGDKQETRAVVLLMPGLFGSPGGTLDLLASRLRRQGYAVLRMQAQPSRFTERARFVVKNDNIPAAAEAIARVLSTRAAECAYAAQAAFAHLAKVRPAYASLPRIAIGFSGGAMTLPTVVAREPGPYAACVMVGGGCHFWLMNDTSNYAAMIDAIETRWLDGPPTPEDKRRLADAYLGMAPLDSFHTAAAMRGRKALLIHGTLDKAVPAPLGDALWERLGRPERWEREYGHESLFMALPSDMGPMIDWLNAALSREEP